MKKYTYALVNKSGEYISKITAENMDEAIKIFTITKKIEESELLKIFSIQKLK